MHFNHLQQQWKNSFEKAISSIQDCLIPQNNDCEDMQEFRQLCSWLMNTEVSTYQFMPHGYQNFRSDPYSTNNLLNLIHHALLDDGDISFVTMKLDDKIMRVFMMFCCRHEDYFTHYCLKENSQSIRLHIDFAKRTNSVRESMKEKYPNNKQLSLRKVPEEKDFVFVSHRNPLQFIQEVEALEALEAFEKKQREDFEQRRRALIDNM